MKWIVVIVVLVAVVVALLRFGSRSVATAPSAGIIPAMPFKVLGTLAGSPLIQEVESPRPDLFRMAVVRGEEALAAIPELDRLEEANGWRAVFLGAVDEFPDFDALREMDAQSPSDILREAETIDAAAILAQRAGEWSQGNIDGAEILGEWPDEAAAASALPERYAVFRNVLTDQAHERVYIAIIPTAEAWQAPAFLQNGSWNDVPSPAEQVSVLRYWQARHGARLRTFSNDVMELEVQRPPGSKDQAMALAKEQYGFCYDIVDQGVGALRPLAATLEHAGNWYFWWD